MFTNVKAYLFGLALAALALQMSGFFGYMTDTVSETAWKSTQPDQLTFEQWLVVENGDPSIDLAPPAAGSPFKCSLGPVINSSTHFAQCDSYVMAVEGSESHAHVFCGIDMLHIRRLPNGRIEQIQGIHDDTLFKHAMDNLSNCKQRDLHLSDSSAHFTRQ